MNAIDIIASKRDGRELSKEQIRWFVEGITSGAVPDYQASAWLMAVYLKGMNATETLDLTLAMRDSGDRIDLSDILGAPSLDKHSTGGVGDKTTFVVAPIIASTGVPMLKMSGRGLGFSGGTVDKLESIPGFRTDIGSDEARGIVERCGVVMIGQSPHLAPADKILYALRDVTATIECVPLITASIMSKKLASGGARIVLDVKCGSGAFMKTEEQASTLARSLVSVGKEAGVPTVARLSRMEEPLGISVGNALEVQEAIEILRGTFPTVLPVTGETDYIDLCIELAAEGIHLCGRAASLQAARDIARTNLYNGLAAATFEKMIAAQGGPKSLEKVLESLPKAPLTWPVVSNTGGWVTSLNAETIGRLVVALGGGRMRKSDSIDHSVGIVLHVKTGARVEVGDTLATLHLMSSDQLRVEELSRQALSAWTIEATPPAPSMGLLLQEVR